MTKPVIETHIQKILSHLPKTPGVYQMKDKMGKVMYVGKAKNLKNRVSSYFHGIIPGNSKTPLNPPLTGGSKQLTLAKRQMVEKIADIEILLCETEVEALVLETNIIKHLTPKYNILMKDDKNLAYLKITASPIPELIKTRQKVRDGGEYFGPYVSNVEESVRALRRIFRIRNCRIKFAQNIVLSSRGTRDLPGKEADSSYHRNDKKEEKVNIIIIDKAGRTIPCMDYFIGLCPAPCLLKTNTMENHRENINRVRSFLSGEMIALFEELEHDMKEKAREYKYEEAQKIKETIEALKGLHERQNVRDMVDGDVDIFMKYEKYEKVYIGLTQVRGGKIIGVFRHEVILGADEDEDVLISFLTRQYLDGDDLPSILIITKDIEDEAFLSFLKNKGIAHEIPKIGPKHELLDFTRNQLREYAYKKELATLETKTLTREHMVHILESLSYEVPKKGEIVFECYDISHTDGHFTYASRVSIVNGKPDTSRYKKYKIKSLNDGDIDDFASHKEVMYRRTLEGLELRNFPHLIIIDGGKGQLSSAMKGIEEGKSVYYRQTHPNSPLSGRGLLQLCSIAKREEEIFLPGKKDPVIFGKGSGELMVLQKARDESHRFSITANKAARMKSMKKNILEELPGFGPVTRKKLLRLAENIDEIKNISLEEIEKICTKAQIETLRDHGIIS